MKVLRFRFSVVAFLFSLGIVAGCSAGSRVPGSDSALADSALAESREPRADSALPGSREPSADSALAGSAATTACGAPRPAVLTGSGVGLLRIGARVSDIAAKCMVLLDTTLAQGAEGQPERRVTVVVAGVNTAATVVNDRIWRIEINSPAFRTSDSLGVGVTVKELRSPDARLAHGEGSYVLRKDHCGLSFRLSSATGAFNDLASVPDTTRVRTVLVTGC